MKHLINFGLLLLLLTSCSNGGQVNTAVTTEKAITTNDTVIGSKTITDEIAGGAYRKRAISYFVINGKDTSKFKCIFVELKDSGKVVIDLNIPYQKDEVTYRQRMSELKKLLPIAKQDFNFDSLRSIYLGRLVQNGDIAIEITKQYTDKFGKPKKITDYGKVEMFLKESQLGEDLNRIFNLYSIDVESVSSEKLQFFPKKELLTMSKIETDTTKITEKILDCMTWVILKKR
jgi:hypothetical protein